MAEDHLGSQPSGVVLDSARLFVGKFIGGGVYRQVFEHAFDKTQVIKLEMEAGHFHNAMEAQVWERVRWCGSIGRWFAPVLGISPWGSALLMARTEPLSAAQMKRWRHIPAFFTDIKPGNFGVYKGRLVCHDYGNHLLMEVGMTKRMRTVRWED
ncbi:MAG: hypothetical protein Q8N51_00780 [Gammaproteobacteria bacterium]|nr:hypothetical protein [Gammaproteobacteria bacterium]